MVEAYREFGHLRAHLDPLGLIQPAERFSLEAFGLSEGDLDRPTAGPEGSGERSGKARPSGSGQTLRDLLGRLEETYCRTLGVELGHIDDRESAGLARAADGADPQPPDAGRRRCARSFYEKILEAELLEQFLGTRFLGSKRFCAGGGRGLRRRCSSSCSTAPRATASGTWSSAWPTAAGSTCSPTSWASRSQDIFAEFRDRASSASRRRRREVPPRLLDRPRHARRRALPRLARLQPEPPGVDRHGRAGAGTGQAGPLPRLRAAPHHAGAGPRRRRLRRPGDRGRGACNMSALDGLPRAAAPSTSS